MTKNAEHDLKPVADYYSQKIKEHGETPSGVDWNGTESQMLRFSQITKVIKADQPFSINDLGCGYGALLDYLQDKHSNFSYHGNDISDEMIKAAKKRFGAQSEVFFHTGTTPPKIADYSVASGIFNVQLEQSDTKWRDYIHDTLDILDRSSRLGFSFNCLTIYSDAPKMRDYLYYSDPGALFDRCKKRYSRNVALLHDYDLYEFTILVRKVV